MRTVDLPSSLVLVPSQKLDGALRRSTRDSPWLPASPGDLVKDLKGRPDGVPATLSEPKQSGDWSLLVYGQTYVARLFATRRGDAYTIASVFPLRINDHRNLVHGYLLLRPRGWQLAHELRRVPPGSDARWPALRREWAELIRQRAAGQGEPRLAEERSAYLATLDTLIDAEQRVRAEAAPQLYPYRAVAPTGERRYRANAVYDFHVAGGRVPEERTFVQIYGQPDLRGQVTRVGGDRVTVRFHQAVSWDRIEGQGELEESPNTTVYDKQREAVALLREGQAHNTSLLPAVVDHQVRPIAASAAEPSEPLDDDQLAAFRKALQVPDLLLVLGPPGTGKTRTISQIADGCAQRHERVLITSNSHRAVDNVLPRLPRELVVVRVGAEGSVTADGQAYLLERQASDLIQRVTGRASRALSGYDGIPHAVQWAAELDKRLDRQATAAGEEERADGNLRATRRAAGGPIQGRIDEITAELADCARETTRVRDLIGRWSARRDRAAARARLPVIGPLFGVLQRRYDRRVADELQQERKLIDATARTRAELGIAESELDAATRDHPAVREAQRVLDAMIQQSRRCRDDVTTAARAATAAVRPVATPPGNGEARDLQSWLVAWLPVLSARGRLLAEWREKITADTDQLHPELIRYADVVAATCIGAASRPELSGSDFDVAIVDEAGQIGTNTALVPLTRARRAVLVGDHMQLPPFLDSEVEAWGADVGDPHIRDLLAKSILELLWDRFPDSHKVLLSRQRRMPTTIADFISATFYGGRLRTAVQREHRDPLFGSPMAMVDTSGLPVAQRREQRGGIDHWNLTGYTNPAEAAMLAKLAALYHRLKSDWAIILPYKAQVTDVRARVDALTGGDADTGLNIGTVDAFQGGERDVILHGFTRSNDAGTVGFLKELRRANVAFTRARHQLVLVGDLRTLTSARDPGFRALARSLRDHLKSHGEIRQYAEIQTLLENA